MYRIETHPTRPTHSGLVYEQTPIVAPALAGEQTMTLAEVKLQSLLILAAARPKLERLQKEEAKR